jgi:hypothetical protein
LAHWGKKKAALFGVAVSLVGVCVPIYYARPQIVMNRTQMNESLPANYICVELVIINVLHKKSITPPLFSS